ncbi:class I SAM-dependent methyltransferase [Candidatus Dojkabacteria bacterium]|uniref:Class I SAM-dependent methyltransferase n=1 Tax=Candidatus Dojkabacteria bacterium TaxID=2099670 RepID=A0A955L6V8_9BACT|nr:class I SAM-dependent methyltransferase [Candidatus Dojkabacteria bacterium]
MSEKSSNPDTTAYRIELWNKEYGERKNLPSTHATPDHPSRAFRTAVEELDDIDHSLLLDLGAGNFRNSIWAVKEAGFIRAVGVEFSTVATELAQFSIVENNVQDAITVLNQSVGEPLSLDDGSVSFALDMMTMHSLVPEDRITMATEVQRVMKPGAYFVFYTVAGLESYEGEKTAFGDLVENSPGPEEGSYRFEVEGDIVTEKGFTESELRELFPSMDIVKLEPRVEFTEAFGDVYKRVYYFGIFQKR